MTPLRQQQAWIRLSLVRSVGPNWNRWLAELAAEGLTLEAFLELPEHEARRHLHNWPAIARAWRQEAPAPQRIEAIQARLSDERLRLLPISDPLYPGRLLADLGFEAPTFLYAAGRLGHLRGPTVALIGTREPSPEGLATARAYAAALARAGVHVVSGHARGIDVAAHEGALAAGGSTSLVLYHGLFRFQPAAPLRDFLTSENALILSQFAPEDPGRIDRPVRRNATIAALADGLIVIESGLVSGTSYAFRDARRMRKPLWSVIYAEPAPESAAGNRSLLSAGARPLEPGETGAQRCATAIVAQLRESRQVRPLSAAWPPVAHPGQQDLFAESGY